MNLTKTVVRKALTDANIKFKEVDFLREFWGTKFSFSSCAIRRVEKLLKTPLTGPFIEIF